MNEKLHAQVNTARSINMLEGEIFPILDDEINFKLNVACSKFRNGEKDFLNEIAYMTAIQDIKNKLRIKQQQGNVAIKKLHEAE